MSLEINTWAHSVITFILLRLHSIIWVNFGMGADGTGGRLVGGSENGTLTVYSPEAIITSGAEAVVGQSDKHTGPVRALDFNPFQVKCVVKRVYVCKMIYEEGHHIPVISLSGSVTHAIYLFQLISPLEQFTCIRSK